ncbi:regulator of nonsense transcripts 3A [Chrysoperla carnea]|uniref:regulator of nonsense transcripts 3A n=1 Tax=Chrysoperla carnea TaxID=189513 RepID=UPI001D09085C|nr:regulator of nonsense transcripts 3A [Chrysoperla carnea]
MESHIESCEKPADVENTDSKICENVDGDKTDKNVTEEDNLLIDDKSDTETDVVKSNKNSEIKSSKECSKVSDTNLKNNEKIVIKDKCTKNSNTSKEKKDADQKIFKKEAAPPQKIVIRRLPPTMSADAFLKQVAPLPEYNNFYFVKADKSYSPNNFARAYINFVHTEDIFIFKEKFDNYVFVDAKGNEFEAVVEFAIFQRIPKRGRYGRKKDNKCGTIECDPAYLKFVEEYNQNPDISEGKPEYSFQLKDDTKKNDFVSTPLVEYVNHRKQEQNRIREEKREERRQREANRRRLKEEERRRKRMVARERDFYKESHSKKEAEVIDEDKSLDSKTESEESLSRATESNKKSSKTDDSTKEQTSDRTESLTFIRTRRESFDSDRSDRSRHTYRNGRFERNSKSKYESSYSSSRNENSGNYNKSSFSKEPYKLRFPQSDKGRKDIYAREERFSRDSNSQRRDRGSKFESSYGRSSFSNNRSVRDKKNHESVNKSTSSSKHNAKVSWKKNKEHNSNDTECAKLTDQSNGDDELVLSKDEEKPTENDSNDQISNTADTDKVIDKNSKKRSKKPDDDFNKDNNEESTKNTEATKDKDDPRKQRRIRNKDRPALQIYRPGMGRFSKERKIQTTENEVENRSLSVNED